MGSRLGSLTLGGSRFPALAFSCYSFFQVRVLWVSEYLLSSGCELGAFNLGVFFRVDTSCWCWLRQLMLLTGCKSNSSER